MSLKINDGNNFIEILFDYITDKYFGRFTTSTIRLNNRPIAMGSAICSLKDNFCKSIGRKLSLTRAIETAKKNGEIDKNISKKIWEIYRKNCK